MSTLLVDGEKFEALLHSLREAVKRHVDANAQDGGRLAAVTALAAAIQFIRLLPEVEKEGLHIPLANLRHALLDHEKGRKPSLLRLPRKQPGAPPHPTELNALKAGAAAAMEAYYRAIEVHPHAAPASARDYAARKTVGELKRRGWKYKGRDVGSTTVANWRDECSEGDRLVDLAADLFQRMRQDLNQLAAAESITYSDFEDAATRILDETERRHAHALRSRNTDDGPGSE